MHPRLTEIMIFVEEKRRELLDSVEGVPREKLVRRPSPNAWSVAENIEHLRMVESGIAQIIAKRVAQAREAGIGEEQATSSVMPSFARYGATLDSSILKTPERVEPKQNVDVVEALDGLISSREALRSAVAAADGVPLAEIKHTHPVVGELDLYQWLIFVGHHEARHHRQIERTLKSISQ